MVRRTLVFLLWTFYSLLDVSYEVYPNTKEHSQHHSSSDVSDLSILIKFFS